MHSMYTCEYICVCIYKSHDASDVHASGTGQLQANLPVVGPRLSTGKFTQMVVTTMGYNELVVGEDHLLGPS